MYLLRHAESTRNVDAALYVGGRSNECELSSDGPSQAIRAGRWLAISGTLFDHIGSSIAVRTQQTLGYALEEMGLEDADITLYPDLQEMSQGPAEGKLRQTIYTPYVLSHIALRHLDFALPGGESIRDTGTRTRVQLKAIARAHPEGAILLAGHGLSIRSCVGIALGWDHRKILSTETPNASLTHLTVSESQLQVHYIGKDIARTIS